MTTMTHMPPLVVDEGDVTVLRRMAAYTWGLYRVSWPDYFDAPELAPDRELGFVAKLPAPTGGRFSRRFVRADAEVDATNGWSNVESILDEAEERTGGDVFFERDITEAGMGRLIPGKHFRIGDVVPVRVWGRVIHLPVTAIDGTSEPGRAAGWRVHVGGQLIADEAGLEAGNRELERVIAQERRERMDADDVIGAAASEAQDAADTAQESADGLTEDLTGEPGGSVPDAVEQRTGALGGIKRDVDQAQNDQLVLHDNQLKWLRWTKTVFNFGFSTASGESYNVADEVPTGLVDVLVNEFSNMGLRWIVRPGWTGTYRLEARFMDGSEGAVHGRATGQSSAFSSQDYLTRTVSRVSVQVWPDRSVQPREWVVQVRHPAGGESAFALSDQAWADTGSGGPALQSDGSVRFGVPVQASTEVQCQTQVWESGVEIPAGRHLRPLGDEDAGVVVFTEVQPQLVWDVGLPRTGSQTVRVPAQTVSRATAIGGAYVYQVLATWRALAWESPVSATISTAVQWASYTAWNVRWYRVRICVNGVEVAVREDNSLAGMNTNFTLSLDRLIRAGDRVTVEAASQGETNDRRVPGGHLRIDWRDS